MPEPGSRGIGLVSDVHGVLEQLGLTDARALAEAVVLFRDHPLWPVWLPVDGRAWTAVRPAGSRPPGPEVPLLWVQAATAAQLDVRMRSADIGLSPPG
jgi:hypothetical protein